MKSEDKIPRLSGHPLGPVPSGGAPDAGADDARTPPPLVDSPGLSGIKNALYDDPASDITLYRVPFLNATFAILSLALLVLTVWAIWQDYSREWKYYQYEWQGFLEKRYREEIAAEKARIGGEVQAKTERLADLRRRTENNAALEEVERRVKLLESDARLADTEQKFHKAAMDEAKFFLEHEKLQILGRLGGETEQAREEIKALEKKFYEKWQIPYEEKLRRAEEAKVLAQEARDRLERRRAEFSHTKTEIAALERDLSLLQTNLDDVEANAKNTIRNLPLFDFFKPSAQIQKVVVSDLTEPLNFVDVPRVDRCKSCHVNIDNPDPSLATLTMEDEPHGGRVFRSHPRLDLYVGSTSPHPYQEFGCTICHYGDGQSLTFVTTSHMPRDAEQKEQWERDYHWHKMHHQDYPMLQMQYISATCAKCHPHESRILGADTYNQGRDLVEEFGCYGCHKIEGFEDYRRAGPDLSHVASKIDVEFMYKWIRNPTHFRPDTRMPRFFDLANSQGAIEVIGFGGKPRVHEFEQRNGVEALALAHYLAEQSRPRNEIAWRIPEGITGDAGRGRTIFRETGCLGCHYVESEEDPAFHQNRSAPDLSTVGSKVSSEWLADWIVNPTNYWPETRMPRLRVEQDDGGAQKVADIVAYLKSLRNPEFERSDAFTLNEQSRAVLKDIAYDYMHRTTTRAEAVREIDAHYGLEDDNGTPTPEGLARGDEKLLAYVGNKLVQRYGCFGCHPGIAGYENAQPIGTDLSKHGAKGVDRLDFGHWGHQPSGEYAIAHSREAWFTNKLKNTRIYDMFPVRQLTKSGQVVYEPSDRRVAKTPEELLKMPLFRFHDDPDRVEAVVTFLLSRLPDPIPMQKMHNLDAAEQAIEDGRRIVRYLNCQGCHRIGADTTEMRIGDLPRFSYFDHPAAENLEGEARDAFLERQRMLDELERETWLAEEVALAEDPGLGLQGITFPRHSFLSQKFKYLIERPGEIDPEPDEYSLVEILEYHWTKTGVAPRDQVVRVRGYGEGKVRLAFGTGGEERALAPPLLRREGERVHGDWLFGFLLDIRPLRPWLNIRMPSYTFTTDQSRTIAEMFRNLAGVPGPHETFAAYTAEPALVAAGSEIFQSTEIGEETVEPAPVRLGCNNCHPAAGEPPRNPDPKNWGPNLGMARERLRPPWIWSWLIYPEGYMPGTKMPSFWFSTSNFLEDQNLSDRDLEFVTSHNPFVRNTGVEVNGGRENWRVEMRSLLQYLMHMEEMPLKTAQAMPRE